MLVKLECDRLGAQRSDPGGADALYRFAFSPGGRWNVGMCVFILWLMRPPLERDGSLSKLLPEVLV